MPPSLVLCSAPVFHASHRGLGRVFPGPRWVALAAADVSRHIRPEGSLANTSCLPWRLQDKVPQALPTPQPCWPALWAPLLPPTGRHRQHLARSQRFSPTCSLIQGGGRRAGVILSAQHPSGLIRDTGSHLGPHTGGTSANRRGSGEASSAVGLKHCPAKRCWLLCGR